MREYYLWQGNKKKLVREPYSVELVLTGARSASGNVVEGDVREATGRIRAREGRCWLDANELAPSRSDSEADNPLSTHPERTSL